MKILHITANSKGGAGKAALRLNHSLQRIGLESAFLSMDLIIDFNKDRIEDNFFRYRKPSLLQRVKLKLQSLFDPTLKQKVSKRINSHKNDLRYEIISTPYSHYYLENHRLIQEADIINLHWVGGILDYNRFFRKVKKPLVWTLHDMNPFLGLFHYSSDEQINIDLLGDLDDQVKKIKAESIRQVKNGAIVTPSKWLLDRSKDSGLFDTFQIHECIPNSVEMDVFKPLDKETLRRDRNVSENEFTILFISGDVGSHRKGLDLLLSALEVIDQFKITVLTVGKGSIDSKNKSIKMIPLGYMDSNEQMAECYNLADVFVMPSREDNLPNVMLESFACGTPVIAFKTGGMKEHIKEGLNGCLAEEMTSDALAETIIRFWSNRTQYSSKTIRNYATDHFSFELQAKRYMKVYKDLIKE